MYMYGTIGTLTLLLGSLVCFRIYAIVWEPFIVRHFATSLTISPKYSFSSKRAQLVEFNDILNTRVAVDF